MMIKVRELFFSRLIPFSPMTSLHIASGLFIGNIELKNQIVLEVSDVNKIVPRSILLIDHRLRPGPSGLWKVAG